MCRYHYAINFKPSNNLRNCTKKNTTNDAEQRKYFITKVLMYDIYGIETLFQYLT